MVNYLLKSLMSLAAGLGSIAIVAAALAPAEPVELSVRDVAVSRVVPVAAPTPPASESVVVEKLVEESVAAPVGELKTADDVARRPNETIFTTMATQTGVTWGLDIVDGTRDGTYTYSSDGSGVRIYIVDTGVDALHPEFSGRVVDGFDAFGQNLDQTDCNGHGTHVAGIAAGDYFGVAKSATIVPVRVMDCDGRGNTSTLTDGINWIIASHSGGVGIVNMSIGGQSDSEVNAATEKLISAGLVVVAAAGNSSSDACSYSPAGASGVIAVGAIDYDKQRASFSNWGTCVDVAAPGVRINSANYANYRESLRMSGTSQAAPFVAGAIATYVASGNVTSGLSAEPYMDSLATEGIVVVEQELESPEEQSPEPTLEPEPVLPEPEPIEPPVVDEPLVPEVTVTQNAAGSLFGKVSWTPVEGATQYRIYKTGTIRPGWRLFWTSDGTSTHRNISDAIGSISIYRVVAMVDSREIVLGEVRYEPTS